jgi:hypothetical protein
MRATAVSSSISPCIQARAAHLAPILLDAYGRAARVWAHGNYQWPSEQQAAFASAVLRSARAGNGRVVVDMAERLRGSAEALADYLGGLMVAATYEQECSSLLADHWPTLMRLGIETVGQTDKRHSADTEDLVRKLLPSPTPVVADPDLGGTLERARAYWPSFDIVAGSIDEWIVLARNSRMSVDALVGLLQAQPLAAQAEPGLDWVHALVVAEDGTARSSGFLLVEWLESLRESKVLGTTTWPKYRAIVDALALSDFGNARELQRRDE